MSSYPNEKPSYRGRFAPSPTGPLHFGSLVCAVASFLQARSQDGIWLVRMEDLDPPREIPGAADNILRTLEHHGLTWDEPVVYQSQRHDLYQDWLEHLLQNDLVYRCRCSRKDIQEQQQALGMTTYPGTCKKQRVTREEKHAIRVRVTPRSVTFQDRIQGRFGQDIAVDVGDFVVKRSDGWFAYQLAVVVDDEEQRITEVVRGCDLLDNTPRQIYLQQQLKLHIPEYAHIPVVTNKSGEKLSKQTFARPVNNTIPIDNVIKTLAFLGQNPPAPSQFNDLNDLWQWAIDHWNIDAVPRQPGIYLTP